MIKLTARQLQQAKRSRISKKPLRIDRHARAFSTAGCKWERMDDGNSVEVRCILPFPNSANTHWRHARGSTYLSADGKAYRDAVAEVMRECPSFAAARLRVTITLHPPTKRAFDLGNCDKSLMDALMHAGIFDDDSQIDDQRFLRGDVSKGGWCIVRIESI